MSELEVSGLLDIGCGDFNWMKEIVLPTYYLGVDIVPEISEVNNLNYGSERIKFQCLDATSEDLPAGYQMILCREVLFHLSFKDGKSLIEKIKQSGAVWLLTTNAGDVSENRDIVSGGFRNIDLRKRPYCFPEPIRVLEDNAVSASRHLGLWKIEDIY